MKRKKWKSNRNKDSQYKKLQENIALHEHKLYCPSVDELKYSKINANTWFDINSSVNKSVSFNPNILIEPVKEIQTTRRTFMVKVLLDDRQKNIIKQWVKAYITMYNVTLKYIKTLGLIKHKVSYQKIRTYHLKAQRNEILAHSGGEYGSYIKVHILDTAIKLACSNFNAALTNKAKGHIKKFRMRYWRYNKSSTVIEIESNFFKQGTMCRDPLGFVQCDNFSLKEIEDHYKVSCFLKCEKNKYTLIIPEKIEINKSKALKEFIVLDPGVRTFQTGLSDNHVNQYCTNSRNVIERHLKKIDVTTKNEKIPLKIKRKIILREKMKIKFLVTELHWKTINHLVSNYKTILIGDMSVKGITCRETSNVSKMTKRVAYNLSFYRFRQRLQNKCIANNRNYIEANEKYTSKTCSKCAAYDAKLGSSHVYNCKKCNNLIDRDINACRCILLKHVI